MDVDNMTFREMLIIYRFASSEYFNKLNEEYNFLDKMNAKKKEIGQDEFTRISKEVGWNRANYNIK